MDARHAHTTTRSRRTPHLIVAAVVFAVAAIGAVLWSDATSNEADALSNGVAFGAYAAPINGLTNQTALEELEDQLGVTLPMVRTFGDWDDPIGQDKPLHRWIRDGNRELMASVKPKRENGQEVRWRDIANAQPGSQIHNEMLDLARGAKNYGAPMILGFHHEPEHQKNLGFGNSDDYKAAFRKLHQVFDAEGATNVRFAWIMTSWAFEVGDIRPDDRRVAEKWYPGDDVVDYLSVQEYNWATCRDNNDSWESLEAGLEPFMRFARTHPSKKLILSEWGSPEGNAGQKAQWIDGARALFKSGEHKDRFAAILYFHYDDRAAGNNACQWWLDSSDSSLEAARRLARDGFYQARVLSGTANPDPQPQPTTTTTPPTTTSPPTTVAPTTTSPSPTIPVQPPRVMCQGRVATLVGTSGDDRLTGTAGPDVIHGMGGNDVIAGLTGDDVICGGYGNDSIFGAGGADTLNGGPGADYILGGYGPDTLLGGKGADRMNGQHGNDTISGNEGRDVLRGGPHQDIVNGGAHEDIVLGQGGRDVMHGGLGNDRLTGGVGPDRLTGGPGNDRCDGGPGRDQLSSC